MRTLLLIAAALVVAAIGVAIVGWLLPVAHVASRSAALPQPPERVYAIVADIAAYPRWWADNPQLETEIVEARPPARFVSRVADPDGQFGGTWTFDIAPEGGGSRLTITEHGEVYNPIFRVLSRYLFGHTGTMESFLAAIAEVR